MHEFPPLQVPPLQSPPLVISATRSNPNLSPQGAPTTAGSRGRRRREEGGVRVTSSIQLVGGETDGLKRRWREASSPPRVTVTVGSSTRINMNSGEVEEGKEGGLDGTYSLPNLSLLRAEARARRPHMGTSRCVLPSLSHEQCKAQKHTQKHLFVILVLLLV